MWGIVLALSLFVFIFVRARANYWVRHRCGEWVIGHSGTVIVSEGRFRCCWTPKDMRRGCHYSVYQVFVGIWRFRGYLESLTAKTLEVCADR